MNSASHSLSNGLGISYVGFEQSFLVHAREKEKILEASCSARSSSSSDSVAAIVHNDDALFVNSIVLKMLYILRWFFDLQFIISRSKWCKSKSTHYFSYKVISRISEGRNSHLCRTRQPNSSLPSSLSKTFQEGRKPKGPMTQHASDKSDGIIPKANQ
jgi:hypothetical protein